MKYVEISVCKCSERGCYSNFRREPSYVKVFVKEDRASVNDSYDTLALTAVVILTSEPLKACRDKPFVARSVSAEFNEEWS